MVVMSVKKRHVQTAVGKRIEDLRQARDMSQHDLSVASGVDKVAIWRIETGATQRLSLGKIEAIAKGLRVPISEILGDGDATPAESRDDALLRTLAARFGGRHGDPEILEALLKAFAKLSPEEQQYQLDMLEWAAGRKAGVKVRASRRLNEKSEEYDTSPEPEAEAN